MGDKVYEGEVVKWFDRRDASGFGFIKFESGRNVNSVFFDYDDIVEDNIGRRLHARIIGNLVRFRLDTHIHRGEKRAIARDVTSIFPTDVRGPENHREISVVDRIVPGKREPIAAAFLVRECGDKLYLNCDGVANAHKHRFRYLRVGQHVWHGIEPPIGNQKSFRAVHSEFYSDVEEAAIQKC
jgi:cold shock CspA family protein